MFLAMWCFLTMCYHPWGWNIQTWIFGNISVIHMLSDCLWMSCACSEECFARRFNYFKVESAYQMRFQFGIITISCPQISPEFKSYHWAYLSSISCFIWWYMQNHPLSGQWYFYGFHLEGFGRSWDLITRPSRSSFANTNLQWSNQSEIRHCKHHHRCLGSPLWSSQCIWWCWCFFSTRQ